jgi:hypothetical protein
VIIIELTRDTTDNVAILKVLDDGHGQGHSVAALKIEIAISKELLKVWT